MSKQQTSRKNHHEDAIALLVEDHQKVQKLFKEFDRIKEQDNDEHKQAIVKTICNELTIHAQIEEEIFYPMARDALDDDALFDEAEVEHASAKELISQIETMEPYDELYAAKITVLGEYVNHHIKEEQDEIFPRVKKAKLDIHALGVELAARKKELQLELGVGDGEENQNEDAVSRHAVSPGSKRPSTRMGT